MSGDQDFFKASADIIAEKIQVTLKKKDRCSLVLAGGNTPRGVYKVLSSDYRTQIPWEQVFIFWGDERTVPPEHQDSNYRMAKEALLAHIDIPPGNIHRMKSELPPQDAADEYSAAIEDYFRDARTEFDIILLGMGDDGHTASLFPGTSALSEFDKKAAAVFVEKMNIWRITLTLPVLNSANYIFFLISGNSKSAKVRELNGLPSPSAGFPASLIQPNTGTLAYILDKAAAAGLNENDN